VNTESEAGVIAMKAIAEFDREFAGLPGIIPTTDYFGKVRRGLQVMRKSS
jgi:hypothetical protein